MTSTYYVARVPGRIGRLAIKEAKMSYFNLTKAMKSVGVSRPMRKRLRRAASQPKVQAAAALVPALTVGVLTLRRLIRLRS